MTELPDVKQKVVTTFPAKIESGIGVTMSKVGGVYTFKLDYNGIDQAATIPAPDYTSTWQLFWNAVENRFTLVPYTLPNVAVVGTSTTSVEIGSGTKSFTVEPGLGWIKGMRLHAAYNDDTDQYIEGKIISYDAATGALSLDADHVSGSGTYASWSIGVAGSDPSEAFNYVQEPAPVTGSSATVDGLTTTIAIERTSPTATAITLPPVADQFNGGGYGIPLRIVDWSSSVARHVITITPDGTETIMNAATLVLVSTALNLASVTLYPSTDLSGWYIA